MNSKVTISAVLALSASLLVLVARPAASATVVFDCSGTISEIDGRGILDSSVAVGTPYSATFLVDKGANDLDDFSNIAWVYLDHKPENAARIRFGNYSVGPDPSGYGENGLGGANDSGPMDQMSWGSENSTGSGLAVRYAMALLEDDSGKALTKKGLPPTGPGMTDISMWNYRQFSFDSLATTSGAPSDWYGTIDTFSVHTEENPVPEPGSLALLAMAGMPALGLFSRKTRR